MAEAIKKGQESGQIAGPKDGGIHKLGVRPENPQIPDLPAPPPKPKPKTLEEIGVTKRQSADAQLLAEVLPDDTAVDAVIKKGQESGEISTRGAGRQARRGRVGRVPSGMGA